MHDDGPPPLPEPRILAIRGALFRGAKIEAIKQYRQATGFGLVEAKEFIEALEVRLRQEEPERFTAPQKTGCLGVLFLLAGALGLARSS